MNAITTDDWVYLKSDTKIEPLSCRWYTWSHLVSPVQHALNIAFRQIPLLKSFVANPRVHEAASSNPAMLGGHFVELKSADVPQARTLLLDLMERHAHMIQFAEDLIQLDRRIQQTETGFSLDAIYEDLPASLAGLIEASYDLNNHPVLRVLEELASEGGLSNEFTQELAFCAFREEQRNFFLNTPRLDSPQRMVLPISFSDSRLDLIAASRIRPVCFRELTDALSVERDGAPRFREFFSTELKPRNQPSYNGEGVRVRYFGHASILVQTREVSIAVDPFVTWDHQDTEGRLTFNDLPDFIDFVFLTHNHGDHFSVELLLQLRNRVGRFLVPRNNANCLADPSMKLALRRLGFTNVDIMDPMDKVCIQDGWITSLPFFGEHADIDIRSKHGMHLTLKGRTFLFLADSDCKDRMLYRRVVSRLGPVDNLFVGMECHGAPLTWLYGAYLTNPIGRNEDNSRRLSGSDAAHAWSIVEEFGCKTAYVYALGQEPWLRFVAGLNYTKDSIQIIESDKFVNRCRDAGLLSERLNGCRTIEY
jgi:L-ascorbate metabolism protein UlaG (beta-lactamase superfamily)